MEDPVGTSDDWTGEEEVGEDGQQDEYPGESRGLNASHDITDISLS